MNPQEREGVALPEALAYGYGSQPGDFQPETDPYAHVSTPARIAIYDDLLSSPRIVDIPPNNTRDFIGALASAVYNEAHQLGGSIPYTVILQVTENFIHARFTEMVISIFDNGQTIRFTDQGPGIVDKEKVQLPGYSSATYEMKRYIHGVGSGLPIVKEYLETKHGTIKIEDNLESGAVVTISVMETLPSRAPQSLTMPPSSDEAPSSIEMILPLLSPRARGFLPYFKTESIWGITDLSQATNIPNGSMFNELKKLRDLGIITQIGKKYTLTSLGEDLVKQL